MSKHVSRALVALWLVSAPAIAQAQDTGAAGQAQTQTPPPAAQKPGEVRMADLVKQSTPVAVRALVYPRRRRAS